MEVGRRTRGESGLMLCSTCRVMELVPGYYKGTEWSEHRRLLGPNAADAQYHGHGYLEGQE